MRTEDEVKTIRNFYRHYSNVIDFITRITQSDQFSHTEIRLLHEIERLPECTSTQLSRLLSLDAGYLSRTLSKLESKGLICRRSCRRDGRSAHITLTDEGRRRLEEFNACFEAQIADLLSRLSPEDRQKLQNNLALLDSLLNDTLRQLNPEK